MRIALDAMGGDLAPQATVEGAYLYQKESNAKNEIVLVGDKDLITEECKKYSHFQEMNISIIHASQVVEMNEAPTEALKKKERFLASGWPEFA